MARPRAADDFAVIRARMEELRRERAGVHTGDARRPESPRQHPVGPRPSPTATARSGLAPGLWRMLSRGRSA